MEKNRELLRLTMGDQDFGVWMEHIEEILQIPLWSVAVIPGCPPQMYGLTNLRGQVLPILDTYRILERQSVRCKADEQGMLSVLLCRHAQGLAGLTAGQLDDVVDSSRGDFAPVEEETHLVEGIFAFDDEAFLVLSIPQILEQGLQ